MEEKIEKVEMSTALANAICDMEDVGFSEGLGPETPECTVAWNELVSAAERCARRTTHAKRRLGLSLCLG